MEDKGFGIYVHIPFCVRKCAYCDFVSYSNKEELIYDYIEALKKEIKYVGTELAFGNGEKLKVNSEEYKCVGASTARPQEKIPEITTIYIGGGTPSSVDSKYIASIIATIKEIYKVKENAEITIEVNPGTVTTKKLKDYIESGINRISIGLQSTDDSILKQIGRIHNYEQFLDTYKMAREFGFKNINVDLMLALPNQTIEILSDSLQKVIELKPEHISVYSLILEEGTKLYDLVKTGKLNLTDDFTERKMYWQVKEKLEQNGYNHYEISNFALKRIWIKT